MPFKCGFCEKTFKQLAGLTSHRQSHTGEKSFQCHLCEKAFAQLSTLKHKLSHTGENRFHCDICEKICKIKLN